MKRILFSTLLLAWLSTLTTVIAQPRKITGMDADSPGPVTVTVQADGMPAASVTFTASK